MQAAATINGVVANYSGRLVSSPEFLAVVDFGQPLKKAKTTGLLVSAVTISPGELTGAAVITVSQVPVFVDKSVAYGGQQNADGSVLTFRAVRDAK